MDTDQSKAAELAAVRSTDGLGVSSGRKVRLESPRTNPYSWKNPRSDTITLIKTLPYFRSSVGSYTHRVRWAQHHMWDGEYSHTSIRMWCGMSGFAGSSKRHKGGGHFFDLLPNDAVLCATCEGRAIGAGQDGSHKINGRLVRYSPRTTCWETPNEKLSDD